MIGVSVWAEMMITGMSCVSGSALSAATKANNFDFVGDLATYADTRVIGQPMELENTNSRLSVLRPASLPKGQTKTFESLFFLPKRPTDYTPGSGGNYSLKTELRAPRGALAVGSPEEVAEKILFEHELFGHDRFLAQISVGSLPHERALRAIELFGTEVAPRVREALARRTLAP